MSYKGAHDDDSISCNMAKPYYRNRMTRICQNDHCRTRLSKCDGRRLRRCAKCVRLGIGKKTRKPTQARKEALSLDEIAQQHKIMLALMKRRGLI